MLLQKPVIYRKGIKIMFSSHCVFVWFVVLTVITTSCGGNVSNGKASSTAKVFAQSSANEKSPTGHEASDEIKEELCNIVINEDKDTIVTNQTEGFVFFLGGNNWSVDCNDSRYVMLAMSEGFIVHTSKIATTLFDNGNRDVIEGYRDGMLSSLSRKSKTTVIDSFATTVGQDNREANCITLRQDSDGEGENRVIYNCITLKETPDNEKVLLTSTTLIMDLQLWQEQKDDVAKAVEGTSGSWFLLEEIVQ